MNEASGCDVRVVFPVQSADSSGQRLPASSERSRRFLWWTRCWTRQREVLSL